MITASLATLVRSSLWAALLVTGLGGAACASSPDAPPEPPFTVDGATARPPSTPPPAVLRGQLTPEPIEPRGGGSAVADAGGPRPDAGQGAPPVTVSASAGATYTMVPAGALTPCSMDGASAELALVNLRDRAIALSWINHECKEITYAHVEAKQLGRMTTYATHRWRVRDRVTGEVLADFTLDSAGTFTATAW